MTTESALAPQRDAATTAPALAGVSLKRDNVIELLEQDQAALAWFEVHPEDFLSGPAAQAGRERLAALRARYPLSLHGYSLGLGAERDLDPGFLTQLRALVDAFDPCLVSDHLAWSTHGPRQSFDAMPPPYDETTLDRVSRHIDQTQEALGRSILLENPSSYIRYSNSTMSEPAFLTAVVRRTGCGLLLDVNNAFIAAANDGAPAAEHINAFPLDAVAEIHLGGHVEAFDIEGRPVLEDTNATPEPVWALYEELIERIGPKPTLIEWNADQPDWPRLNAEARRANAILARAA